MHIANRYYPLLPLLLAFAGPTDALAGRYAEYRVTIVGPANSFPADMNQSGTAVSVRGINSTETRSYVYNGKAIHDLGLLGGRYNRATAINDKGEILGNWITRSGQRRGYVYHRGTFRQLGPINGLPTSYIDINNAGYILASNQEPATDTSIGTPHVYLRAPNGKIRELGTPPFPNLVLQMNRLNNRNQVVGQAAPFTTPEIAFNVYLWNKGVLRQLDSFGMEPNIAQDINDRGQVAGYTSTFTFREQVATVWTHGRPTRIDTRPLTGFLFSSATAINNHGHVVGSSDHTGAFVYRGRRMESLNALIDPASGWDITNPVVINDAGQILARARRNGVDYTVRLDLKRPHALGAPYIESDEEGFMAEQEAGPRQE